MAEDEQPSISQSFKNFRTFDARLATKLRMTFSNNFKKLRTRKNCCGNPGQPGC